MCNPLSSIKIALFSYNSLGDGLVFLTIADNLRRANYQITYFSDYIAQLATWLPQLNIYPFPSQNQWEQVLESYDIVIMDAKAPYMHSVPTHQYAEIAKRFIFIAATRVDYRLIQDVTPMLQKRIPAQLYENFKSFSHLSGPIQSPDPEKTIVDGALSFCQDKLGLNNAKAYPDFTIPFYLKHQRYRKRIIISPMSPNPNKNWTPEQFIKLAIELRKQGYEVYFVVAPKEHCEWSMRLKQQFPLPLFPSINQLAAFIYESATLISNDSGNGHLASILNIPTLTIYKRNKHFPWRPGWRKGIVITPKLSLKLFGQRYWKPFISTQQISQALTKALKQKSSSKSITSI